MPGIVPFGGWTFVVDGEDEGTLCTSLLSNEGLKEMHLKIDVRANHLYTTYITPHKSFSFFLFTSQSDSLNAADAKTNTGVSRSLEHHAKRLWLVRS